MIVDSLDEGEATIRKIMWRIMPLLMGMMLLSVIDRSNVGFAKLQMVHDLNMTETTYGLASSLSSSDIRSSKFRAPWRPIVSAPASGSRGSCSPGAS